MGKKILTLEVAPSPTIIPQATFAPTVAEQPTISIVAQNLEIPWSLVFLSDKSVLFTERPGRVRFISADGSLDPKPVAVIADVYANGEGGLLGIEADPQFGKNKLIYLCYSYNSKGRMLNKVVQYEFVNRQLIKPKVIVDEIPGNSNHDGGRIKFGPDGYLYITTGDSQDPSLAQNKLSTAGKILRVTRDGRPAPGNPFGTLVYSYGHRNPQGLTWDDKGRLWATEHGRSIPFSGFDELNLIEKGKNYGWPTIQGDEKASDMVTPVLNSGATTTWAPSGVAFYLSRSNQSSVFFGGLKGQGLYEAVINGTKVTLKKHFDQELGRIRDVVLGPDNMLYITTSNRDGRGDPKTGDDKILRLNPGKL